MSETTSGLDWLLILSLEEFRNLTERFTPQQASRLRRDLIEKAQDIIVDLSAPRGQKLNRDGFPMTEDEYLDWKARAEKALSLTESQIAHLNTLKWSATAQAISPPVLRRVLDLAEQGADFGNAGPDERNALRIFRHYVGGM